MPFTRKSCNNEFGEFSFRHSLSGRWELRALKAKEKKKKMGAFSFLSRVLHTKPSNYSKLLVLVSVRFSFILLFSFLHFFFPINFVEKVSFWLDLSWVLGIPTFFWLILSSIFLTICNQRTAFCQFLLILSFL